MGKVHRKHGFHKSEEEYEEDERSYEATFDAGSASALEVVFKQFCQF